MSYLRSLIPNVLPSGIDPADDLKIWQERILHIFLLATTLASLVLLSMILISGRGTPDSLLLGGALFLFFASIGGFLLRSRSYWIRSIAYLVIFYVFATLLFIHDGWSVTALILLLSFSFLSSIFLYQRPSRVGMGISLATLLFWAVLADTIVQINELSSITINSIMLDTAMILLSGFIGNLTIISLKNHYLLKRNDLEDLRQKSRELEEQYHAQEGNLEKRLQQLRTASEISRTSSSILNPQILIQRVAEMLRADFALYYVGVFLIDSAHEYAVLRYGTGEPGRKMVANHHRLAVGGYSMIGWATQTRKARIALDVGEEAVHFDNPNLPETRSELALPIISPNGILGALSIQSTQPNAFDENDLLILQSIADSLAVALENANSFEKTQQALEDIRVLNKAFVQQAWGEELNNAGELAYSFENPQAEPATNGKLIKVPLVLRDETIGFINLEVEGNELSEDQKEFLQTISTQTTIALENARLLEETQRAAAQEQKLNDISTQFSRAITIEDILRTAVVEFGKLPSVSEASISLLPPEEFKTDVRMKTTEVKK